MRQPVAGRSISLYGEISALAAGGCGRQRQELIAEVGPATGLLVVMCHGFPESWYSWRHQLIALAEAGYHAVAPDMRGFGQTDKPEAVAKYTMLHHVGDLDGLLDALKRPAAVVVGHDWGGSVAWTSALLRPDRFRAVAGMSVPFFPRGIAAFDCRSPAVVGLAGCSERRITVAA